MEESDGNMVRFRLIFDNRHLLDKSQRSQGYHCSWFFFKPDITNIGDLASQIRECFGLRHRIVLFMDEFALPSFESTCVIRDKDIIMVKKKEAKQKDICKPRDDGMLTQEKLQGNGSYDKETLTSYVENALHLASPGVVGSTQQKRKRSKKHLDSKHKEARRQMDSHSSDGEQNVASVVPLDYIRSKPREHGTQQAGETQKPLLFEEGSNKEPVRNKENSFPKVTNNDQCLKVDGAPVFEGILSLPIPKVMSSTVDITKPCKHVIHLEILLPLQRLPVKGDILTYRYVESSSLVHPQLSSPKVGEVSSFDDKTLKIVLLPVLDYVFFYENPHGTIDQPNASLYKEDGSLEIEYLSLVDVRLVKAHDLKEDKACQDGQARNAKWEEASLKGNWNDPNASTAEQSNSSAQWIPNKSATAMSWSFKRHNAPFAGRGNGRANWASNRSTYNWMPNKNTRNWDPHKNTAVWNPNRSHARFASTNNISTLQWEHHQIKDFSLSGSFFGSEKQ